MPVPNYEQESFRRLPRESLEDWWFNGLDYVIPNIHGKLHL